MPVVPVEVWGGSGSAGQQSEWIRLRLQGGYKGLYLSFRDRISVDDFEVNACGQEHTHNT